jgi:hypothetical protein
MVKKLKDVNGDGKRNFKDTWLGEKLLGGGKTKGPNLKESMAGARRESSPAPTKADATKAKPTTKTTSNNTAKTTATKATPKPMTSSPSPKSKPMQSSAKPKTNPRNMPPKVDSTPPTMISPKPTPIVTGVVGGNRKASMSGNAGAGASAKATVAAKKPKSSATMPARNMSPTPDKGPGVTNSPLTRARMGSVTKEEYGAMPPAQRKAKGLPLTWADRIFSPSSNFKKSKK